MEDFGKEKEASGAEKAPEAKKEEVVQVETLEKEPASEKKGSGSKKEKKEKEKDNNTTEAA